MAKHKRPTKPRTKMTTRNRGADMLPRLPEPAWTDLEQTFFASAPPDEPEPSAAPDLFDDLVPPAAPSRRQWTELRRRLVAALTAPRVDLRIVTIALASVMLLIGLSAVVFASRH
jgi:hypothetical protein